MAKSQQGQTKHLNEGVTGDLTLRYIHLYTFQMKTKMVLISPFKFYCMSISMYLEKVYLGWCISIILYLQSFFLG